MRLNLKTDYALRILLHAARRQGQIITSQEVADTYNITLLMLLKLLTLSKRKTIWQLNAGDTVEDSLYQHLLKKCALVT